MGILTPAQILTLTDRIAGRYALLTPVLQSLATALSLDAEAIYGGPSTANVSIGEPDAISTIGKQFQVTGLNSSGTGVTAFLFGNLAAGISSYLQRKGGVGNGLAGVTDLTSYLRRANGCPDPTYVGAGAGSTYSLLAHPTYAAFISAILAGASPLPPDVVFAPTGFALAGFDVGTAAYIAGAATMTPLTGPYAPAKLFTAATPASGAVPNGSIYLVITGLNQAGVSVTWRGDGGTGLTGPSQTLAAGIFAGTSGGANGGTAAPADRLKSITGIALDAARASTATAGRINIVALAERPTL